MVEVSGPACAWKVPPKRSAGITIREYEPLIADAKTLGDALAAYSREYGVRIRAYDGSDPDIAFSDERPARYFIHEKPDGDSLLVDIHIERGAEEICPKQDLGFALKPGDRVRMGLLAC